MLFNSGLFFQFFAAFLLLYFLLRNSLPARNWLIVAASYIFYGAWDYRFLFLLIVSSVVDFAVGRALGSDQKPRRRRHLLVLSLAVNLGILGFFKYCNFFVESFGRFLEAAGLQSNLPSLNIVLPVGISFYTFQTMSYTIDVYRNRIPPCRSLVEFLAYVSFFPQLVAGPIERAAHLLPQFRQTLTVTAPMLRDGIWLCIWGMFKKVVIADRMAPLVEMVFGHPNPGAAAVFLGTVAFGLQIYGDFSGYSDIARGLAKILGFDLMVNFNLPYLASNIREFWQRWHISLSTWLRDYLYISLGGNRHGPTRTSMNLFITMLLGGLWHGANWTFILWGAWHGTALVAHRIWGARRQAPSWNAAGWVATMLFVLYGWLLFRAESVRQAAFLTHQLANWTIPAWLGSYCLNLILFSLPLVVIQLWQFRSGNLMAPVAGNPSARTWILEGLLLTGIILFWEKDKVPFIYFQF